MKKAVITMLCILLGLAGLFMSACGGYFTLASLHYGWHDSALAIALPSLLAGVACIWGTIMGFRWIGRMGSRKVGSATPSDADKHEPTPPS
jgi:hypothetical protein